MKLKKLLLAALVAVSSVVFVAASDKDADSPTKAFEEFINAVVAQDVDKMVERFYFPAEAKEAFKKKNITEKDYIKKRYTRPNFSSATKEMNMKVIKEEVNGDKAFVFFKDSKGGEGKFICVKDGKWKIDYFATRKMRRAERLKKSKSQQ